MLKAAAMPTPKDAEEYYCLRQPDPDETGSSLRSSPDVVARKGNGAKTYENEVQRTNFFYSVWLFLSAIWQYAISYFSTTP